MLRTTRKHGTVWTHAKAVLIGGQRRGQRKAGKLRAGTVWNRLVSASTQVTLQGWQHPTVLMVMAPWGLCRPSLPRSRGHRPQRAPKIPNDRTAAPAALKRQDGSASTPTEPGPDAAGAQADSDDPHSKVGPAAEAAAMALRVLRTWTRLRRQRRPAQPLPPAGRWHGVPRVVREHHGPQWVQPPHGGGGVTCRWVQQSQPGSRLRGRWGALAAVLQRVAFGGARQLAASADVRPLGASPATLPPKAHTVCRQTPQTPCRMLGAGMHRAVAIIAPSRCIVAESAGSPPSPPWVRWLPGQHYCPPCPFPDMAP